MNSIVVYDKKNYFFRFLKYKFKDHNVIKKNVIRKINIDELKKATLIFIVIYEDLDILPFMFFHKINNNIIVCSDNKFLLSKYEKFGDILCYDLTQPKLFLFNSINEKIGINSI